MALPYTFRREGARQQLAGAPALAHLTHANAATLSGRQFFPHLIAGPFRAGLHETVAFVIPACLVAALASWSRGRRYIAGVDLS